MSAAPTERGVLAKYLPLEVEWYGSADFGQGVAEIVDSETLARTVASCTGPGAYERAKVIARVINQADAVAAVVASAAALRAEYGEVAAHQIGRLGEVHRDLDAALAALARAERVS